MTNRSVNRGINVRALNESSSGALVAGPPA